MAGVGVSSSSVAILRDLYDESPEQCAGEGDLQMLVKGLREQLISVGSRNEYGSNQEWYVAVFQAVYGELTVLVDHWATLDVKTFAGKLQRLLNGTLTVPVKDALGKPKFEWSRLARVWGSLEDNSQVSDGESRVEFDLTPRKNAQSPEEEALLFVREQGLTLAELADLDWDVIKSCIGPGLGLSLGAVSILRKHAGSSTGNGGGPSGATTPMAAPETSVKRHGVSLFGAGQEQAPSRARLLTLAGQAPDLGSRSATRQKPTSGPTQNEDPMDVRSLLSELVMELKSARSQPNEDHFDDKTYTAGVKGVEKLERARNEFASKPEAKYRYFIKKVMQTSSSVPAYMKDCTQVTNDRFTTYVAQLMLEILAAAEKDDSGRVLGLACGGLQMLEQWSLNGALELGWLYTLLPDSPLLTVNQDAPVVTDPTARGPSGRRAFATTVEPPLLATALASMKNYEELGKLMPKAGKGASK